MIPPQLHISFDVCPRAGFPPTSTVGHPGAHGDDITGTQGIGVSTPSAAAVAEATCGFAMEEHMPKGIIFTKGLLQSIVANGILFTTFFSGVTVSVEGAAPKAQLSIAPPHTHKPILIPLSIM